MPRDDAESKIGTTLSFSDVPFPTEQQQDSRTNSWAVVSIGLYLAEFQPGQSIDKWIVAYEEKARIGDPTQIRINENFSESISRRSGLRYGGTSQLGTFHVAIVPVEKIVWFIWSNAEGPNLGIYNHMVASFNVGNRPPKSLKDVYGADFKPMPLTTLSQSTIQSLATTTHNPPRVVGGHLAVLALGSDPAGYRLPFTGQRTVTQGPGCGATHVGRSSEAIDYSMPNGTAIKATYGGVVAAAGWNNQGFGNLIQIDHGPSPIKRSYYGHLQSMFVSPGVSVSKGQHIGNSDNTGNSTGPHLHFEVRNVSTNSSIWIRTLPTTVWYSGNANSPCTGTGNDPDGYATGP